MQTTPRTLFSPRPFFPVAALALLLTGPSGRAADTPASLTLYNQQFGVIREHITVPLTKGMNDVRFTDITAHLEPDSVILRDPSGKIPVRIREQNYQNDPVSQDLLLAHFEGKEIDFETTVDGKPSIVRGTIVRAPYVAHQEAMQRFGQRYAASQMDRSYGPANAPIIRVNGQLRFNLPGIPLFPALADDSILKPTLYWKLQTDREVKTPLELSYVSGGFSWSADYNIILPEKGDVLSLVGWITMENESGRTFPNAVIKLMAGDVSKIQQNQEYDMNARQSVGGAISASGMSGPAVTEKTFDEYHLYSLPEPTTLRDRETKQVEFLRAEGIKSRQLYIYNGVDINWQRYSGWDAESFRDNRAFGTQSQKKVWAYREFVNNKENQLGIPLPKGRVRFYRQDSDGNLEFIGENTIDHTPQNETVKVYTGDAFDLVGERKRTDYKKDNSTIDEAFQITLRNRKKEAVEIKVMENLYRGATWEITQSSDTWKKTDSQAMEFLVKLEPDQEKVITYKVHYSW